MDGVAPLNGIRVLALEQMQAVPFATQLLGRLGADVVKVEAPGSGDSARAAQPSITDPDGRPVGATFLRNNLGKRSVTIDLKQAEGRDLVLGLVPHYDVVAENFKAGALDRLGLGYGDVRAVHPAVIYASVSGFGGPPSPYAAWPAYASVVEAMSGIYELKRAPGHPPTVAPVGALGDISAGLFAAVGILAALRHRDRTGEGQRVDVAMFDAMVAVTDIVTNMWSLGLRDGQLGPVIMTGFVASDGWFTLQVGREHQFAALARLIGHEQWIADPRFATRQGWVDHLDGVIRPALEAWAATRTKVDAARTLSEAGLAAGPCLDAEEVVHDPHLAQRHMLVEMARPDGVDQPVLIPGNPVKLSAHPDEPAAWVPWLGEHTDAVLGDELGLGGDRLRELRDRGVI